MSVSKKLYEKKPRVRVCGILEQKDHILLLKHETIGKMGYIWSPPGGGLEFGESAEEVLIREFKEETGLTVDIDRFLFVNEYLDDRFHAIELFFDVKMLSGEVYLGTDPEVPWEEQILTEYKFFSFSELNNVHKGQKHNIFSQCNSISELRSLRGFYNFINI